MYIALLYSAGLRDVLSINTTSSCLKTHKTLIYWKAAPPLITMRMSERSHKLALTNPPNVLCHRGDVAFGATERKKDKECESRSERWCHGWAMHLITLTGCHFPFPPPC